MIKQQSQFNYDVKQYKTLFTLFPTEFVLTMKWACFDLDWTIGYGANKLFPSEPDDIFLIPDRRKKLVRLCREGYSIIIFTNQFSVTKNNRVKRLQRIETLLSKLPIPVWVLMAVGKDKKNKKTGEIIIDNYRKPAIGMWEYMINKFGEPKTSFFCGDAAGRLQDFSDSDLLFAQNIGVDFYNPSELFPVRSYPPRNNKELVVFVGMPGSGKTTYFENIYKEHNYIHVNQDKLRTKSKVLNAIKNAVKQNRNIVIDATNPKLETRQEYYKLVDNDYKITVVYFIRDGRGWNKTRERSVPDIAYHRYFKYLEQPKKNEAEQGNKLYRLN